MVNNDRIYRRRESNVSFREHFRFIRYLSSKIIEYYTIYLSPMSMVP
jgi:hypothetical protein